MRIWDIHPSLLCRKHLLGEHRELHAIWSILIYKKRVIQIIRKQKDGSENLRLYINVMKVWQGKYPIEATVINRIWIII